MPEEAIAESVPSEVAPATEAVTDSGSAPQDNLADQPVDLMSQTQVDDIFGLESKTGEEAKPDEPMTTDTSAPRQGEDVKTPPEEEVKAEPEAKAEEEAKTEEEGEAGKSDKFETNEKLDWETAPKEFRAEFQNLKEAFMEVAQSSQEAVFITDPLAHLEWMKTTSPTSFKEVGMQLATDAAQANPKGWIEFFVENHPDTVAQMLTGREDITLDKLKAEKEELDYFNDGDETAVNDRVEAASKEVKKPEETPEQKQLREFLDERKANERRSIEQELFSPIEAKIDNLVEKAGYAIELSEYQGKDFNALDEDTQFKVMVNEMIPVWIDLRIKSDPKLVSMQSAIEKFLEAGDKTSALKLQHHADIVATNFANEVLSVLSGNKAKVVKSETVAPVQEMPKMQVKSAGAGAVAAVAPVNGNGASEYDDLFKVTEADLVSIKR